MSGALSHREVGDGTPPCPTVISHVLIVTNQCLVPPYYRKLIPSAGQPGPAGRSGPAKQGSPQQHHAAITAAGLPSATMQANGGSNM